MTDHDGGGEILVGVVSRGFGCALKDFPGIYGRITAVLPWIKNQLAETCNYIRLYPSFRISSFLKVFTIACDIHLNPLNLGDSTRATSNPATPYLVTLPTPTPGK